jgi:hypothetical protein
MRRTILLGTVALIAAAMIALSGAAASADEGGAQIYRYDNCSTGLPTGPDAECQLVVTPSGTQNLKGHASSEGTGPAGGGGATISRNLECGQRGTTGRRVVTPSGNVNFQCHGAVPE